MNLGTHVLTSASLQTSGDQQKLATLGSALTQHGDLMLYGCDVGGGGKGDALLASLSKVTGADVAASVDATGSRLMGGNWVLEKHTGDIETHAMAIEAYSDVLTVVTFNGSDPDLQYNQTTITRTVDGQTMTFIGGNGAGGMAIDTSYGSEGLYALEGVTTGSDTKLTIRPPNGYTFDITGLKAGAETGKVRFDLTFGNGTTASFDVTVSSNGFTSISSFPTAINDVTQVVITSDQYSVLRDQYHRH